MTIEWLGHACFKVTHKDYQVIFDPYEDGSVPGLSNLEEAADLVLCSHEHHDHNARNNVRLLSGHVNPWTIQEIHTWHDEVKGAKRGNNIIRILTDGNLKIAHLGDLGCEPEEDQMKLLEGLDAMMVPVGGFFTIGGAEAAGLVKKLDPKVIYPMHYRDDAQGFGYEMIGTLDQFTGELPEYADRIVITKPKYAK